MVAPWTSPTPLASIDGLAVGEPLTKQRLVSEHEIYATTTLTLTEGCAFEM